MFAQKKISTYVIKKIVRCVCIDIDATRTALLVGVKRKLIGQAECAEAYFGARRKRGFQGKLQRGRGTGKQPVFGIFARQGEVFTEIIPSYKQQTVQDVIRGKVAKETVIGTAGWRGYDGLVAVGYDKPLRVNPHQNEFSQGNGLHLNGIESFGSFTERRLAKFNGVKVNFPRDCQGFCVTGFLLL